MVCVCTIHFRNASPGFLDFTVAMEFKIFSQAFFTYKEVYFGFIASAKIISVLAGGRLFDYILRIKI